MTAGETVGSHHSTDTTRSPLTDGERCQSPRTEAITDETGTEKLTKIGGIEARQAAETDAPLTRAVEVTEIGTGLLPLGSRVGAAVGMMVPNRRPLPLVLNFQIVSLLSSLEGIVAR